MLNAEENVDSKIVLETIKNRREELLREKSKIFTKLQDFQKKLLVERSQIDDLLNSLPSNTLPDNVQIFDQQKLQFEPQSLELDDLYKKFRSLVYTHSYLTCVQKMQEFNEILTENLKNGDFSGTGENFDDLRRLSKDLKSSRCQKLRAYVKSSKKAWKICLQKFFRLSMDENFQLHGYPTDGTLKNLPAFKESLLKMAKLCRLLYGESSKSSYEFTDCLLTPLRKRFVFYFSDPSRLLGASTAISDPNSPKPEWYLSLILKWHQKYTAILQSLADRDDVGVPPREEGLQSVALDFCRGLVILARERFKFDLTLVLESEIFVKDEKAFPHLIDEAVAFDVELREIGFLESDVGCMELLTEPGIFERWFELEQQQCTKCMENLLADKHAWSVRFFEASDLDHFKVPRCVDNFFALLTSITHRYKLLRSNQHRLRFAHLQRTLIDDFRMHLFELTRTTSSPWAEPFPQIINAANYVKLVLIEWQELPFFVDLEPGLFDQLIDLFEHFRCQMLSDAKETALDEMRPLLSLYRRDVSSQRFDENAVATILVPLQSRLMQVKGLLSSQNFRDWLKVFTENFETLLLDMVVFEVRVDAKVGMLMHDQLAVILPRLLHTVGLVDHGVHFRKLAACLTLHSLNVAGCMLLKSALHQNRSSENVIDSILAEMNLSALSGPEVESLLQRRSDILMT